MFALSIATRLRQDSGESVPSYKTIRTLIQNQLIPTDKTMSSPPIDPRLRSSIYTNFRAASSHSLPCELHIGTIYIVYVQVQLPDNSAIPRLNQRVFRSLDDAIAFAHIIFLNIYGDYLRTPPDELDDALADIPVRELSAVLVDGNTVVAGVLEMPLVTLREVKR